MNAQYLTAEMLEQAFNLFLPRFHGGDMLAARKTHDSHMTSFIGLRIRLVIAVLLTVALAWVLVRLTHIPWIGFVVGLVALTAAWIGGERFILRQMRVLSEAAQKLTAGDLSSRTGLTLGKGEFGKLARTFDTMAESLQQRARERDEAEQSLLNRAFQQTVVAALGQLALISNDFQALLDQTAHLVSQTLEVEFCEILELLPGGDGMILRAGVGWKNDCVGKAVVSTEHGTVAGQTLVTSQPIVIADLRTETVFKASPLLREHGIVSGITMVIATRDQPFGVLGAHTTRQRTFTGDEIHFLVSIATVLAMAAERNRTEAQLQRLAAFAQFNPNPAMELAEDGTIAYFNDAARRLAESVKQEHPRAVLPPDVADIVKNCLATGQSKVHLQTKMDGRTLSWSFHPVSASRIVHCYVEDITNRLSLEEQLRQAQKMESIGQLAAGVAHDFNNMLTIIQGHSSSMLSKPNLPPQSFEALQAVFFAAERAAALTRQLLLFSRRNVLQARALNLREVVSHMTIMLQRLLGETIALEFNSLTSLPAIRGDSGMMEQIVMNLSVNARDAMPRGGKLTITLDSASIDEMYVQTHPDAQVGEFVRLEVADTGHGMDGATLKRIFEPFFTTKEVGKGTGLGLATVYGIVKQHKGWIEVTSEVGKGSTFTVYLPATSEPVAPPKEGSDPMAFVRGGNETILVVEDEPILRDMAQVILEECGYQIFEAATGKEALDLWDKHSEKIDLLLTDMVMPDGMSGRELAETLLMRQPKLKVIFTSGYSMDDVNTEVLSKNNARFLQKPYTRTSLARAVRLTLDGTRSDVATDAVTAEANEE